MLLKQLYKLPTLNQINMFISHRTVPVAAAPDATPDTVAEKEYENDNTLGYVDDINTSIETVESLTASLSEKLNLALGMLKHAMQKQLDHLKNIDIPIKRLNDITETIIKDLDTATIQLGEIRTSMNIAAGDAQQNLQTRKQVFAMAQLRLKSVYHNSKVLYAVLAHKPHGVTQENIKLLKAVADLADAFEISAAMKKDNVTPTDDIKKTAVDDSIKKVGAFKAVIEAVKAALH